MSDARQHYVVAVRRHERRIFLIWFSSEKDGLLTAGETTLMTFASDEGARAYAVSAGLSVSTDESAYFDFDEAEAWAAAPNPYRIRPDDLLNAWNMLTDVAESVGNDLAAAKLRNRRDFPIYDRLVSCCDIPALERDCLDHLTPAEYETIAAALRHGLACFDQAIAASPPAPAPR